MPLLKDPVGYFWSKVQKTDTCWLWVGYCKKPPYGNLQVKHITYQAHCFSYMLAYGLAEKPKLDVLHKCDVPACVNPEHLFLGTHQDNMADMVRKKRHLASFTPEVCKSRWRNRSRKPEDHPAFGKPIREHVKQAMQKAAKEYWRNPANREKQSKLAIEHNKNRERRADGTFKRKGEL